MAIQFPEFSHAPIDIHSHFNHGSPYDTPQTMASIRDFDHVKAGYSDLACRPTGRLGKDPLRHGHLRLLLLLSPHCSGGHFDGGQGKHPL